MVSLPAGVGKGVKRHVQACRGRALDVAQHGAVGAPRAGARQRSGAKAEPHTRLAARPSSSRTERILWAMPPIIGL